MPKYVIEREVPGVGDSSLEELRSSAQASCDVLRGLGPGIQWQHSYFADDKIYCVYIAQDESLIEEHARQSGFPASRISRVREVIDPTTAEATVSA